MHLSIAVIGYVQNCNSGLPVPKNRLPAEDSHRKTGKNIHYENKGNLLRTVTKIFLAGGTIMDCKERILSNDYYDILTDFPLAFMEAANLDQCFVNIENLYSVVYLNRGVLSDTNEYFYDYRSVPKLYGLMQQENPYRFDPNSMIVSGITQVQRDPLRLTGRGVIVCLIDTGERVIILQKTARLNLKS